MYYLLKVYIEKVLLFIKKSFKIWISLIILSVLVQKIDVQQILNSLLLVNPVYLLVSLSLIPVFEFIRCTKWQMILIRLKYNTSRKNLLIDNLKSYPLNATTPSNIGDVVRVYYLYKRNIPRAEAAVSVISDRLFDIISTLLLGTLGFFILPITSSNVIKISIIIILLSIILCLYIKNFLVLLIKIVTTTLGKIFRNIFITQSEINHSSEIFVKILTHRRTFVQGILLGLFQWTILLIQSKIILLSLGYDQDMPSIAAVVSISWIAALVPVTISGLGVREGVGVYLFGLIGIPGGIAFTFFLLTIILYQIILSLIGLILIMKSK